MIPVTDAIRYPGTMMIKDSNTTTVRETQSEVHATMTTMIASRRNEPLAILAEWNGNLAVK